MKIIKEAFINRETFHLGFKKGFAHVATLQHPFPLQSIFQKWLRVHRNIHIELRLGMYDAEFGEYQIVIKKLLSNGGVSNVPFGNSDYINSKSKDYEEALEIGFIHVLNSLPNTIENI